MAEQEFYLYEPNRKGHGKQRIIIDIEANDTAGLITRQRGRTLVTHEPVLVETATTPAEIAQLRNAVLIGEVLRTGSRRLPGTIAPLLYFDADREDRAVVVTSSRGEPLSQLNDQLPLRGQAVPVAIRQLFEALEYLDARGVVHADIHPGTVRWDGSSLQIAEFGHATLADRPRSYAGNAPWACPEQAALTGPASCSDDVYSAGLLLLPMIAGVQPDASALDLQIQRQDQVLARALRAAVTDRISASRILDLLGLNQPPAFPAGGRQRERHATEIATARQQFVHLRERQNRFLRAYYARPLREPEGPVIARTPSPPPAPARAVAQSKPRRTPWIAGLVLVLMVAIGAAVWMAS